MLFDKQHILEFKLKDRYFRVGFDEGLTEMQPNEYYTDIVEVKPVATVKTVINWEEI